MSTTTATSSENDTAGDLLIVPVQPLEKVLREELPTRISLQREMGVYYLVDGIRAILKDLYAGQFSTEIEEMIRELKGLGDDDVVQLRDHPDLASECFVELVLRRLRPLLASLGEEGISKLV